MSTLLREVIAIPERTGTDDYVLRLTEGVGRSRLAQTVADYVVTDALADAFDQALDLVSAAVRDGTSRAAFLSGSFGSGKSHFMAVLHALLGHDPGARAKPELAPVIARHDDILGGKQILRLAYHFLDAHSVEEAILGGYVAQIRALHPEADLPAVHRGDAVIADGEAMRERLGDDAFFSGLNEAAAGGSASADPWSSVLEGAATWTASTYDAARAAPPGSATRQALVSALVRAYFTAFTNTAEFVSLDEGLAAITRHAKSLGYDAVVMFLDELVLWLAFAVRNREMFGREAQKITKLVESGSGERVIPLVSFVARQMDLRRYFVDAGGGMGAEQEALDSAFRHQEGRFATIVLGDDNLPYVAEKRLLRPVDDNARRVIDDAFARLDRRPEVWDVLLDGVNTDESHRGADQAAFRRTYPFSPALVSTLRTLASAMQRDRTALKVMQQLLVDQRETLTVDSVIPVGDVFDLVVEGNQALTPEMAGRFKSARTLYDDKLRPLLLREHALTETDVAALPRTHPFHADDRLVKTLVLSAVAPEVPALKELTAARLAALNHGSIVSPLPGQEATVVLSKVRRWAADVPEIHVTADSRNPVIRVRIAEVDYESVVEKAKGEDNDGRRREALKRLVWEAFGLADLDGDAFGVSRQPRVWRGSRRDVEVVFGNVRDVSWLTDGAFEAGPDAWRFVVDYPFDEEGRSARDDLARLDELKTRLVTRTIVWVPRFLTRERRDELGRLVILDWVLGGPGDRWTSHANHLAEADRVQARIILESQRDALRERMRQAVQEAYGAARPTPGTLEADEAHDRVLISLYPELSPAEPVGHDLAAAFANLVDQAYSAVYPGHPHFEPEDREVRSGELAAVVAVMQEARADPDGRTFVEPAKRDAVRRVANPLDVGHMGETHFLFSADRFRWNMEFSRAMGRTGIGPADPVTVGTVREWIRAVDPPVGLRPEVEDLLVCAWVALQGRAWYRYGSPMRPAPHAGALTNDIELRPEPLPASGDWKAAVRRAGVLFGTVGNPYLTGSAVAELSETVKEEAARLAADAAALVEALSKAHTRLGLPVDAPTGRLATARATHEMVVALRATRGRVALVETLAHSELPCTDEAAARSLRSAREVAAAVNAHPWEHLQPLTSARAVSSGDQRSREAKAVVDRLRAAVGADELAQPLAPALKHADDEAFTWALSVDGQIPPPPPPPIQPASRRSLSSPGDLDAAVHDLREFTKQHRGETVVVEWRLGP